MDKLPQYNVRELRVALTKLGFKRCPAGNHQHKYKHSVRKSIGRRPYLIFPDNIGKKREFQKAIVRDLVHLWGFSIKEVIESLS